ncbi:MAG: TM2 domain-containing protein [Ruminococcaceae bacterium]|nr:TM2 domain-containing protein [Oscillospiraceae bacterium]
MQDEYENKTVGIELLLCFFLGTIGAHKFYRKQFGWGIAYLFTGGLFMIGWVIDTVKLLMRFIKSRKA